MHTAGVFRSLRRAAKGAAFGIRNLFEKSLIKNFIFCFLLATCRDFKNILLATINETKSFFGSFFQFLSSALFKLLFEPLEKFSSQVKA